VSDNTAEITLKGIPAAPGVSHGPAFVFIHREIEVPLYKIDKEHWEDEKKRFEKALINTRSQVSKVRREICDKIGESEAQIFDAHLLVLEDKALIDETIAEFESTGNNIDHCFASVSRRYIDFFDSMEDEYLRERVSDIRDVSKRVLENLIEDSDFTAFRGSDVNGQHIIVSNAINASDVAQLKKDQVIGFVSELGGSTSHAVIMARSMQVPAVVGVPNASEKIRSNDTVLVDGYDGLVIINPSVDSLYRYGQISEQRKSIRKMYLSKVDLPPETKDGKKVHILSNIEHSDECDAVFANRAEGVGLFRTEGIMMRERHGLASEESQFQEYRKVVEKMAPLPVTIRTLDIGGDKNLPGGFAFNEDNPFMGFRAIRFCLKNPEVFKQQLRAILRAAAYGNVKIMYPMISSVREVLEANQLLQEAADELKEKGENYGKDIEIGSMIEVPSAAYTADVIAENCSFLSIGTNDLIQYMLAVDRVNDSIAHLYEPSHPAVLRTIRTVIHMAHEKGVPVSICGEMASDPIYVPLLIGMGADDLSMSSSLIPEIKFMVRHIEMKDAENLAGEVLELKRPRQVFSCLKDFYRKVMVDTVGDEFIR